MDVFRTNNDAALILKSASSTGDSGGDEEGDDVRDQQADEGDGCADTDLAAAELLHGAGHARVRVGLVGVIVHARECERGIHKGIWMGLTGDDIHRTISSPRPEPPTERLQITDQNV